MVGGKPHKTSLPPFDFAQDKLRRESRKTRTPGFPPEFTRAQAEAGMTDNMIQAFAYFVFVTEEYT